MLLQSGVTLEFKKLLLLKDNVFWEGMCKDVAEFVLACTTCQQTKYISWPPFSLPQSICPPSAIWEDIALDFIVGLPAYQGQC